MKKFLFLFLPIVMLFFFVDILPQVNNSRMTKLPNDPNFIPKSVPLGKVENGVKWEEIFNSTTEPAGWQVIDNDASGLAFTFEQQINFSGGAQILPQAGQSFYFSDYTGANSNGLIDEWLISPKLPLIETGDSLIFYAGAIDGDYKDSLKVLISTTNNLPGSFTEIAYFKVDGPISSWNRYAFDLSAFAGSEIYFAINYYIVDGGPTGANSDNVWVDHFILKSSSPTATARVQVIHNSSDVLAGSVDVYVNYGLAIPDFGYRAATPFIDLPAGVTLNIGIAPGNSTSVNDTIANFPVVLSADEKYVVFANGLLTSGYTPNPDGRNTDFTLFVKPMARESASGTGVDLFVLHGSTDAPAVDVKVRELGSATIVNDAAYGDITDYINAPSRDITLDLYLADGTSYVTSFSAPLSGLEDGSAAVFASGFLDPTANQNGAGFGLFAALANGTVVQLPATGGPTSVENIKSIPTEFVLNQNYPNPFNPSTVINFSLPVESDITLKIFNVLGQEITTLLSGRLNAGSQEIKFDATGLKSGIYFYQIDAKGVDGKEFRSVKKMILTK
jgi:hypothetical protein